MTVHELLVSARNLIDRDGWIQLEPGCHKEGETPACALNAMSCADDLPLEREVSRVFAEVIGLQTEWPARDIPRWNDEVGRTKAEVLAAFDAAIAATSPEPDVSFIAAPKVAA